jgi:hypothetical protein
MDYTLPGVGGPGISLLQDLVESKSLKPASMDRLLELLRILEGLSADPITMSCAMIHAAADNWRN